MRLQEFFLFETSEEDRAILSLAKAIGDHLLRYSGKVSDEVTVGKIGDLFNTPLEVLNPITINLETPEKTKQDDPDYDPENPTAGTWSGSTSTITLNSDLIGSNSIKTYLAHELRHALDDYKSNFRANSWQNKYSAPSSKLQHSVRNDPYSKNLPYLSQPNEINARFLQALYATTGNLQRAAKTKSPQELKDFAMTELKRWMQYYQIDQVFADKNVKGYKRLLKRGVDYLNKEISHLSSKLKKSS